MNRPPSSEVQLGELADEFIERLRGGERPTVEQYAIEHPLLADEIRDLFPTLLSVEEIGWDQTEQPETEQPPEQLGEYRILRKVGAGGMGIVYEAEQETLGRHVALKVLPQSAISSPESLRRFQVEARAAAILHHPNIVPVFGVGQDSGTQYYVMQYIEGQGLDSILEELRSMGPETEQEKPITSPTSDTVTSQSSSGITLSTSSIAHSNQQYFRNVAKLGADVCEAICYAHQQGILHRDIKPSNLLLDRHGTVWVTDFGLAKTTTDELTRSRELVGTLRYMGPERFNGQSDVRSDIYSLGLTLYELLTFQPAYSTRDRAELIRRITLTQPAPPRKVQSGIPRDLETVVLKAIEKDPAARYQNASEMAEDLRRFLVGKPIVARRTSLRERTVMWCRRNPLPACLTAGLAALVLLLSTGYSVHVRMLRSMLTRTETAQRNERLANEQSRWRLLESLRAQAEAVRATKTPGRRIRSFAAIREAAQLLGESNVANRDALVLDLRNQAIASMGFVDVKELGRWNVHDDHLRSNNPRWSFNRHVDTFAGSNANGDVFVRSLKDASLRFEAKQVVEHRNGSYRPYLTLSPSDRFVAIFQADRSHHTYIQVLDTESGEPLFPAALRSVGAPHWKPLRFAQDRDLLYFFASDGLKRLDCETGVIKDYSDINPGAHLDLSPGGDQIVVAEAKSSTIAIYSTETGESLRQLESPAWVYDVKWSQDGRLIAAATRDQNLYVWSAREGTQPISTCRGHTATVRTLSFSPSGMLASSSWDRTTRLWNPLLGKQHVRLDRFAALRFSEDGEVLGHIQAGNETGRLAVLESEACLTLTGLHAQPGSTVEAFAFSADSKWLVTSSYEDGLRVWRTSDGVIVDWKQPHASTKSVAFDHVRNRLISSGRGSILGWELKLDGDRATLEHPRDVVNIPADRTAYFALAKNTIVTQRRDGVATVFDLESGAARVDLETSDWINDVTISPDGRYVALGTWMTDKLRVYDANSGELAFEYEQRFFGSAPKFSPDGEWLALCVDGAVELFRVSDWSRQSILQRDKLGYPDCAFSHDMKWIAMSDLHHVKLYRFPSLELVAEFSDPFQTQLTAGHPEAPALAFSPDGKMLAIGTYRDSTMLWKLDKVRQRLRQLGLDWKNR